MKIMQMLNTYKVQDLEELAILLNDIVLEGFQITNVLTDKALDEFGAEYIKVIVITLHQVEGEESNA